MDQPTPPAAAPPATLSDLQRSRLLLGCGALLAVLLLAIAVLLFMLWWSQRPIRPVVLSEKEKATVEEKLRQLGGTGSRVALLRQPSKQPSASTAPTSRDAAPMVREDRGGIELDRPYTPGSKTLRLTEREINGLLNLNTELGQRLRFEFGVDAINAYLAVPIPQDSPILPGRMFRARGRFLLSLGNEGKPVAALEDLTVFGLSLPKAWLGGIKGENLLADAVGEGQRGPFLRGIKSLRLEPGALVLEVED